MERMNVVFVLAVFGCFLYGVYRAAVWAEEDAMLRGKPPWLVKIAVVVFFPWGLIAWLLFRPDPVGRANRSTPRFDLNNYRQQ